MSTLEIIFELFNPSVDTLIGNKWDKIKFKLSKLVIYGFIGCVILYSLSLYNSRGTIEAPGILISFSAFAFSGLLIISGLIDLLSAKFPGETRFSLFLFVIFVLSTIFIGSINLINII